MKTLRWILNRGRLITTAAPLTTADSTALTYSTLSVTPAAQGMASHAEADRVARIATLLTADTDARLHRIAALLTTDMDA